jgi:hypothetical protein
MHLAKGTSDPLTRGQLYDLEEYQTMCNKYTDQRKNKKWKRMCHLTLIWN